MIHNNNSNKQLKELQIYVPPYMYILLPSKILYGIHTCSYTECFNCHIASFTIVRTYDILPAIKQYYIHTYS